MPRAIWSGSISFGLVNIPVKLYSAVSRKTVHFNQLDARTNARIKQKRVSADDGDEVPYEQIVKGYELSSGAYVVITDDELAALDPKALRTIDIDEFVDLADIDPIFYDSAYYLAPDKAAKPYALLAEAMEEPGKVGIAHFVMRTKQYLAAIRPKDGKLLLSTMVYADEINDPSEIPELAELDDVELSRQGARRWPASSSSRWPADFEPEKFHDTYREAVLDLIERKAAGEEVVGAGRGGRAGQGDRPHGRARGVGGGGQGGAEAPPDRADGADEADEATRPRRPAGRRRRRTREARRAPSAKSGLSSVASPSRPSSRSTATSSSSQPRQGALSRGRVHQGRGHRLLRPHRAGDAAPTSPDRCVTLPAVPERRRRPVVLREALPVAPARVGRGGARARATAAAPIDYCLLDDRAALVWAANLAALELHTPMARADDIETPTMVVFDLDPGAPAGMTECAEVALDIRDVLDRLDLELFAKTSGSKGLQLYLPLNTPAHPRPRAAVRAGRWPSCWRSTTATGSCRT